MDFPTRSSAIALLSFVATVTAGAQSGRLSRPGARFEVALASPAVLVQDGNGSRLQLGFAPVIGGAAVWSLSPRLRSTVGLRGSTSSLGGKGDGSGWKAGRSSQLSLQIGLEHETARSLGLSVSAGPTLFYGPGNVIPFRDAASPLHWGGSAGASWRVMQSRPVAATVGIEGFMVGGASQADPIVNPAWVRRVLVGVRYGR